MLTLQTNISIPPEQVFLNIGQDMSSSDSSNAWGIQRESDGLGLESPSGPDIFHSKVFEHFHRTSVRESKMHDVYICPMPL